MVRKICWRRDRLPTPVVLGFPCGPAGKESTCNAGDLGSIPGLGRSPGEGKGYPLQYSGLENSMDYTFHGVANNWIGLSEFHFNFTPYLGFSQFFVILFFFQSFFLFAFHFESFFGHIFKSVILSSVLWSPLMSTSKVLFWRFPGVSVVEKQDMGLIPGLG